MPHPCGSCKGAIFTIDLSVIPPQQFARFGSIHREIPESMRCLKHCTVVLCLDNAFALIDGHPPVYGYGAVQSTFLSLLKSVMDAADVFFICPPLEGCTPLPMFVVKPS